MTDPRTVHVEVEVLTCFASGYELWIGPRQARLLEEKCQGGKYTQKHIGCITHVMIDVIVQPLLRQ